MKSIRTKIILTLIFFLAVGLGGLSLISYYKTQQLLKDNLGQSLTAVAQSSGRELGLWIDARKAEINLMANSRTVIYESRETVIPYLVNEVKRNKIYEMLFVADLKGDSLTSTGTVVDVAGRSYFKAALLEKKTVVSDPFISMPSAKPAVAIAAPITRNGKVDGVMGGTILLEDLLQKVASIKVGKSGYAYLSQGNGLLITHPGKSLMQYNPLLDKNADISLVEVSQKMVGGEAGFSRFLFDDEERFVGYAPVPGTSWSVAVTAPVAELSGQLVSLPFLYLIISLFSVVIAIIISAIMLGRILVTLRMVTTEAVRVAEGDFNGEEIPVRTNDEVGWLASAFNDMLSNLKKTSSQLQVKSLNIISSTKECITSAENIAAGANRTVDTIRQVASSVERITGNAGHILASSVQTAGYARECADGVRGIKYSLEAIKKDTSAYGDVIAGINQSAPRIIRLVEMIAGVADKTGRMALNIAVEAAKAGEQGRGFAVIAEEARELSLQTADAANQLQTLLIAIQEESKNGLQILTEGSSRVDDGSSMVDGVGGAFEKLIYLAQNLVEEIGFVEKATHDLALVVENASAAARQQTATLEKASATTEHLTDLAKQTEKLSLRFKL